MPDFIPDNQFVPDTQPSGDSGGFIPDSQFTPDSEKYGTPGQQAIAGLEGAAKGLAGPLATAAETGLGVSPSAIRGREAANPITHLGGELAGLVGGAALLPVSQAGTLGAAGEAVAGGLGLEGAAATAVRLGTEGALYSIGDETSKAILGNPASIQTAALHVGLNGILGAGLGAGLGQIGELWSAKFGPEAESFVSDFSNRLKAHSEGTIPTADLIHEELSNEFGNVEAAKEGLRGAEGLKAHELSQLMPQTMEPEMVQQGSAVLQEAQSILDRAEAEPGIYTGARLGALKDYGARLATSLAEPDLTPQKIFMALDDFKKGLGTLKKWDIGMGEVEKPAAALMGDLYNTVRNGLEDSSVWGKAGERQESINKLWTEHIPATKDFQRALTEKVGSESVVSPGKVNSLVSGLGKPSSEIKLDKLQNYIDSNDKLYKELEQIHANLGVENPYKRADITNTRSILGNLTPGMKAADFVNKQAVNAASEAAAGGIGAALGHLSGIPGGEYLGGMFGHYAIKPLMRTIMPTMIKPLLGIAPSGAGFKAALDSINAIAKGETLLNNSVKALFEVGGAKAISELVPDKSELDKLQKKLAEFDKSPESVVNLSGKLDHYMPEHATALTATAQEAMNYLESQKPKVTQLGVLDKLMQPSPMQDANYKAALEIAASPLSILSHVKNGSLQPMHVQHLKGMFPAVFPQVIQNVMSGMVQHTGNDGVIPFKMRGSLGLLLGQPVDSTFTQQSIASAQATYPALKPPQMAQNESKPKKDTSKLGKSAELARSPAEARQDVLQKA